MNVLGFEIIWKMGIASLKLPNGQKNGLFGEEEDENSIWYTSRRLTLFSLCLMIAYTYIMVNIYAKEG